MMLHSGGMCGMMLHMGLEGAGDSVSRITGDADGLVTLLRQLTDWWIGYQGWYQSLDRGGWRMRPYPSSEP
jgi:hypothetical protein